jgi:hypothetical protein
VAGLTVDVEASGLTELIAQYKDAAANVRAAMEEALAEQAIAYNQDLRGAGPGSGVTPFDTGRLLMSGNIAQQSINLTFTNDARDPDTGVFYAGYAHQSGDPRRADPSGTFGGGYATDTADAFAKRFGAELLEAWETATAREAGGDGG